MKTWEALQRLQNIKRFAVDTTVQQDTVAAHTLRVIYLASKLAEEFPSPGVNKELVMELAMIHDIEESLFGDIPAPYKRYLTTYKSDALLALKKENVLDSRLYPIFEILHSDILEAEIVNLADKLDFMIFTSNEIKLGNNLFNEYYSKTGAYFSSIRNKIELYYPMADRILGECYDKWNRNFPFEIVQNNNLDWSKASISDSY